MAAPLSFSPPAFAAGTTYEFSGSIESDDGSPVPWSTTLFSYELRDDDGSMPWCCDYGWSEGDDVVDLSQGAGIAVDPDQGLVTISLPSWLQPGFYRHLCTATDTLTGKVAPVFDGQLTIEDL